MTERTLSHYRLFEKLGAGGMGEVYRAKDTKLGRDVAIKILPEAFARQPDRLARLRREAQVLAALNHPNIAAIYDLDESHEHCLLALELVPGPTLVECLQRGPLPMRAALDAFRQIAGALAAAHEKGIIHRDLKPANIKLTPEGQIKLLDFGLAKATAALPGSDSGDLTTATQMTEAGTVLGTILYMSPEQARGQPVDKRADIWAFGCLLYEALSGKSLFSGRTPSDILASILRDTPKLEGLPADTPAAVRLLVERCLRHDLNRRMQDIGDARVEIEDALAAVTALRPDSRTSRKRSWGPWIAAAGLLTLGVCAGWWARSRSTPAAAVEVRFQRITDLVGMEETPAMSPDGKTVAFVAMSGAHRQIWVRLLSGGTPLQITHDDNEHREPRWAPDSSALLYYTPSAKAGEQGTIWEISALGGASRRIASALRGGDISHDGRHIAVFQLRNGKSALMTLTRDGVESASLPIDVGSYDHPRWSPDDRWIALRRGLTDMFDEAILLAPAAGGKLLQVARGDALQGICWLPDGSGLVYSSSAGSTVLYPPIFNLRTVRRDGSADRQVTFGDVSYIEPDMNISGKLLASRIRMQSDVWRFPVSGPPAENTGAGVRVTHQTGQAQTPSVSPDGKEVVYLSDNGGHGNLWVAKTDGSGVRQITFEHDPAVAIGVPKWSPAGDEIAFILTHAGKTGEWLVHPDGSGLRELVKLGSSSYWSLDGRWFYYCPEFRGEFCIEKVPVSGGPPVNVRCQGAEGATGFGADGTLYFLSMLKNADFGWDWEVRKARPENGPSEVLIRVPASRIPYNSALFQPVLSPDGRWLATPLIDGVTTNLWALPAEGGPMRRLTDFGQRSILITRRVAWAPDGKWIYAAVAEPDADIVLLDGLLR